MSSPVEHIRRFQSELATIRHDIHAHPELAYLENRTSDIVASKLQEWGLEVTRGLGKTGLVGTLVFHHWLHRPGREALAKRMDDGAAGGSLRRAQAQLDELKRFMAE